MSQKNSNGNLSKAEEKAIKKDLLALGKSPGYCQLMLDAGNAFARIVTHPETPLEIKELLKFSIEIAKRGMVPIPLTEANFAIAPHPDRCAAKREHVKIKY